MEIKLTADRELLDVLRSISGALWAGTGLMNAPEEGPAGVNTPEPEKPVEGEKTPAISRDDVQHVAVRLIQAGKRDEVKALLAKYGAERVGAVPDDKLAAFFADLEGLQV